MANGQTSGERNSETQVLRDALVVPIRMSIVWNAPRGSRELAVTGAEGR
ncbi:hypothetical protein [Sphaerisporangium rhizosphaerae]|uniref:Uncharacterized protein n=1 Tax=Sphaerisporangium rhizosphaerae TaxID=2269375 RepID=A0ABW2NYL5_9ACTN